MEIWKSLNGIVEYGDYYEVSNTGLIRSVDRFVSNQNIKGRMLKIKIHKNGYCEVVFTLNRKQKTYKLHRLVALAFIPNPENKPEVNHIDGDKKNCNQNNLEWSTRKENAEHAVNNGLHKFYGEHNPMSKLTDDNVREIRELYKTGNYTMNNIADKFDIGGQAVSAIINNRKWTHID